MIFCTFSKKIQLFSIYTYIHELLQSCYLIFKVSFWFKLLLFVSVSNLIIERNHYAIVWLHFISIKIVKYYISLFGCTPLFAFYFQDFLRNPIAPVAWVLRLCHIVVITVAYKVLEMLMFDDSCFLSLLALTIYDYLFLVWKQATHDLELKFVIFLCSLDMC